MIVRTAAEAARLLSPLVAFADREAVAILHLDDDQELLALTVEGAGDVREVDLPVRAILQTALRLGSRSIVVAHNHPGGDPAPSAADEAATRALAEAALRLDIRLHDHLVFGGSECRSFRELGLL